MAHVCLQPLNNESVLGTNLHISVYKCGGCNSGFETICTLHEHMLTHTSGGSYHYDHSFHTAFPKYGSMCKESQTDISDKDFMLFSCPGSQMDFYGIHDVPFQQKNISSCSEDFTNKCSDLINKHNCVEIESQKDVDQVFCQQGSHLQTYYDSEEKNDETIEKELKLSCTAAEEITKKEKKNKCVSEIIIGSDDCGSEYIEEVNVKETVYSCDTVSYNQKALKGKCLVIFNPVNNLLKEKKHANTEDIRLRNASGKSVEKRKNEPKRSIRKCLDCDKAFSSEADLRRHQSLVHSEGKMSKILGNFQCKHCDYGVNSLKEFQKHIREEHNDIEKKFSCPYCEEEFSNSAVKSQHIDDDHPEIAKALKKFHQSKNGDLQTACEMCGKLFSTAAGLALHMSSIHLKKKFKCDICNVELSQKFSLKAHKIEKHHENLRGFDCNICKKTFAYRFRLKAHVEQMHTPSDESTNKYICETCGYFSKSKAGLRYHLTKHDEQRKQYQCEICPYKTYYKGSIAEHMASHQGNRRFVCDVCGDKFFTGKQLKVHMRRHTGELPYQCLICGKRFRTDIAYARHRDIHLNKMRFKCEYCDKEFVQKTNCLAHMRQHTGEKPFKCDWCGQSFTHNVSRKNHMNKCNKNPIQ